MECVEIIESNAMMKGGIKPSIKYCFEHSSIELFVPEASVHERSELPGLEFSVVHC